MWLKITELIGICLFATFKHLLVYVFSTKNRETQNLFPFYSLCVMIIHLYQIFLARTKYQFCHIEIL